MKNYTITVNGSVYDVVVEEGASTGAPVARAAAPKAAPVAAPKAAPAAAYSKPFGKRMYAKISIVVTLTNCSKIWDTAGGVIIC